MHALDSATYGDLFRPATRSLAWAYDLLLVVVGKSEHEVADFVSEKLSHIECVQGTVTHFVLKRYKEDGEVLEGEEGVKRQPVIL